MQFQWRILNHDIWCQLDSKLSLTASGLGFETGAQDSKLRLPGIRNCGRRNSKLGKLGFETGAGAWDSKLPAGLGFETGVSGIRIWIQLSLGFETGVSWIRNWSRAKLLFSLGFDAIHRGHPASQPASQKPVGYPAQQSPAQPSPAQRSPARPSLVSHPSQPA